MADKKGGDKAGSMKPPSSVISTSNISGERAFESTSTGSGSILVFEGISKFREVATPSSDGTASKWPTSMKRDISTQSGLPFGCGSFEMDARKKSGNHANAAEKGCYIVEHDSQHRSESSCSNSLSVFLPVEAHKPQNCSGSVDNADSKGSECRSEETMTASSESGISVQIARKAIRNARSRNMKISSVVGNRSSFLTKNGATLRQDEEISNEWGNVVEIPEDCVGEASDQRMISSEITGENENKLAMEGKPLESCPELMGKNGSDFLKNEIFDSSRTKYCEKAPKDHDRFVAGFDLNDDITTDVVDDLIQPVVGTISSHSVIHVVAKAGVPRGLPTIPLKFEGGVGWKGSSETSAFRSTVLSQSLEQKAHCRNYSPAKQQSFAGFDLNVAAEEDNASTEVQDSCSKIGSQRTESLDFDLNCLYDAADESTQPSIPRESKNPPLMDLNLDVNTSVRDEVKNSHWLHHGCQPLENKTWDSPNKLKRDFNHAHVQQYVMAAPNVLQPMELMQRVGPFPPNLPFSTHALPPHAYPFQGPFHLSSRDSLPSNIHYSNTIPYGRYPQENGFFPVQSNPGMVHSSVKADAKTEDYLSSRHGRTMDEARQFPFLSKSSPTDERMKSLQQETWYATSTKRKETEGGLEYVQLGYRQVT